MKKVKFLLLDDSEMILRHVSKLLNQQGWEVVTAPSMAVALQAYGRHKPDVLLVDFILEGGVTGLQAVSAIFAADPSRAGPPPAAILTHGQLAPADEQRAGTLGVKVIQKPARGQEAEFVQSVQYWLKESKIV